ncbi:MAG: transposase [Saprospiraceae bacterium]|nr:transposase [Saprospiraceae bacterium]
MKYVDSKNVENFSQICKYEYKRTRKVFSESFKKQKVDLIESGKMTTGSVAAQFDVSYAAVYQWVKKYGKVSPPDKIVIETDSDYLKVLELQKEKSNLERILGKQQIRIDYYETLIEMAKEHYKEDIEKKFLKK